MYTLRKHLFTRIFVLPRFSFEFVDRRYNISSRQYSLARLERIFSRSLSDIFDLPLFECQGWIANYWAEPPITRRIIGMRNGSRPPEDNCVKVELLNEHNGEVFEVLYVPIGDAS